MPHLQPLKNEPVKAPKVLGSNEDGKLTTEELRDVPDQRSNLVLKILEDIDKSKRMFTPVFDQMKRNMFMVKHGRDEQTPSLLRCAILDL